MGKRYWHLEFDGIGFNYRMTEIQAAVGLVQLHKLDSLNARRIEIAAKYSEGLAGIQGLQRPHVPSELKHVFHVYVLRLAPGFRLSKEDFMWELYTKKQIKAWSHYMPIHLTAIYRSLGHGEGECPVAEAMFESYVSIPIHPRMTEESIQYVIDTIRDLA